VGLLVRKGLWEFPRWSWGLRGITRGLRAGERGVGFKMWVWGVADAARMGNRLLVVTRMSCLQPRFIPVSIDTVHRLSPL